MNNEDIIRMAHEAGLLPNPEVYIEDLERFAALVTAAEREACAKVCEDLWKVNAAATECAAAIRARRTP